MNIQHIGTTVGSKVPSFSGNVVSRLTQIIPDTKVAKTLTELDKLSLSAYLNFKQHKIGITPEDIANLSKFEGVDFINNAYLFLTKKLGLRETIFPSLQSNPNMKIPIGYTPLSNTIHINLEQCTNTTKSQLFSLLRHELHHFMQNSMIYRHEKIGLQAVKESVQKAAQLEFNTCKQLIETNTPEQLKQFSESTNNPNLYPYLMKFRELYNSGDKTGLNAMIADSVKVYENNLLKFRENLIKELGVIKSDSSLTPKIEKYYDDFCNVGYYNTDGSIDLNKYMQSYIECETMARQEFADIEFTNPPCFIRHYKDRLLNILQGEDNPSKALTETILTNI